MRNYTVLVLDQSDSMNQDNRRQAACASYNEVAAQAKLHAKDGLEINVGLLTFRGVVYEHLWNVPAEQLPYSTDEDYVCDGSTALNDAIGYAIEKLIATTNVNDPENVYLIQVVTDGGENASNHYPKYDRDNKLSRLISSVQDTGRWTISIIGCDSDYLAQLAAETSIPVGNMGSTTPKNFGSTTPAVSANVGAFYTSNKAGVCRSANLAAAGGHGLEINTSGGIVMDYAALDPDAGISLTSCVADADGGTAAVPKASVFYNSQSVNWDHRNLHG